MKTIRSLKPGHFFPDEEPRRFVALRHLRFGAGWLKPGDEVPIEEDRNYGAMIRHGDITQVIQPTSAAKPTRAKQTATDEPPAAA